MPHMPTWPVSKILATKSDSAVPVVTPHVILPQTSQLERLELPETAQIKYDHRVGVVKLCSEC